MNHRDWLLSIHDEHGYLTPLLVREEARPKESPGHGFVFNIPPKEAAEQHYLSRAHRLIQLVRVEYRAQPDEPPRSVRVFHSVTGDDEATIYSSLDAIIAHPDKLGEARQAAVRRLREAEAAVESFDVITTDRSASSGALAAIRAAREMLDAA